MIRFSNFEFKEKHWAKLTEMPFELPNVQAHRGYWVEGKKQNSVESLLAAQKAGYTMAEVDLRLTRDGKIILFHDPILFDVDQAKKIRELSLEELRTQMDVDTLEEAFEAMPKNFFFNLEIKNESKIDFSLEEKLLQFLKKSPKIQERILVSSFNPLSLMWFGKIKPEIPRALLVSQEEHPENSFLLRELSFLPLVKPHFLNVRWEDLDHYRGIPADRKVVWTLNEIGAAETLMKRNKVHGLITDSIRPDQLHGDK